MCHLEFKCAYKSIVLYMYRSVVIPNGISFEWDYVKYCNYMYVWHIISTVSVLTDYASNNSLLLLFGRE